MINNVTLTGRLTKDPELRYTPNGDAVANFTLAVNRPYTNDKGERPADFIPIVAFRKTAQLVAEHMSKGQLVGVEGQIRVRSWDKDGERRYITEVNARSVAFLEPKKSKEAANSGNRHSDDDYIPF